MRKGKIIMIDNYDSFTYNLVQYLGEMGQELVVYRNDKVTLDQLDKSKPDRIVISPGPGAPKSAGISTDVIRHFAGKVPILGVCLGHQCIGAVYGGVIERNWRLMHGKISPIRHNRKGIFQGLPNPFTATRYHSLVISDKKFPKILEVTARTKEGEIMGIRHRSQPVYGVQFHPESILTEVGKQLLGNFLRMKREG